MIIIGFVSYLDRGVFFEFGHQAAEFTFEDFSFILLRSIGRDDRKRFQLLPDEFHLPFGICAETTTC
jgi:hypothetical protein